MTTFATLSTVAADTGFEARIDYAMMVAAAQIAAEDPGTASHDIRKAFAAKVIAGNYSIARAALAVLTNSTIAADTSTSPSPGSTIPDSDIQFAVNSLWNTLAGV